MSVALRPGGWPLKLRVQHLTWSGRTPVGAEQSHDSPCVLSAWLKGAGSELNPAVKSHNHDSALKETKGLGTHSVGDVQHLCSLPKRWSQGLQFMLHSFLLLFFLVLFLHQRCCTGIVTQEAQRTDTKPYCSVTPTNPHGRKIEKSVELKVCQCQQSTLLLFIATSSCKGGTCNWLLPPKQPAQHVSPLQA